MRRKSFASKKPESSFESWSENMPKISKSLGVRDFSLKMAKTATTSLWYNIGYPAKDLILLYLIVDMLKHCTTIMSASGIVQK